MYLVIIYTKVIQSLRKFSIYLKHCVSCKYIKIASGRKQYKSTYFSEIAKAIGQDFRTLPIFEKSLYEYTYRNHYSLQTNEYLKCRWKEFKATFEKRKREPVQFADIR